MDNSPAENEESLERPAEDNKKSKKKAGFWRGFFTGIFIILIVFLLIFGGLLLYINHEGASHAEEDESGAVRRSFDYMAINEKLAVLKRVVDRYFLFDSDIDEMETGIYRGMIDALGDKYTVYYTPEEYQELTEEIGGTYYGIGALVTQDLETGIVTIIRVFRGSPAEEAGLMRGDIIYKVNGKDAASQDLDLLVSQEIRGAEGTTADIVVIRGDEELEFEVLRREVAVDTVDYELLSDGKTGYIIVGEFDLVTAPQFAEAIDDLERQGMTQLVIDLRDNPGGELDTAVSMAAYILPDDIDDGTIISTADKNGRGERYYSRNGEIGYESDFGSSGSRNYPREDGHEVDIPIAILVNENSASASELFSGALRDYGAAKLVGTTTFGKGIVQSLIPLNDGSAVKITVSHYYTPSGYDLHEVGLTPDLEVEYEIPDIDLTESEEDVDESVLLDPLTYDNQLIAAVEMLDEENEQ